MFNRHIHYNIYTDATLKRENVATNATFKNERRFQNGSVIGTYRCKDESGNTVFVRYYADDSSYGYVKFFLI